MKSILSSRLSAWIAIIFATFSLSTQAVIAAIDLNSNGISDIWEILYPLPANPDDTNNVTGVSYRNASVWGTNPLRPDNEGRRLNVAFNSGAHTIDISWPSVVGKSYQLQSCSSFGSEAWSNDGEPVNGTGRLITVSFPQSTAVKMYRLQVADKYSDNDGVSDWEKITIGLKPRSTEKGGVVTSAFGDSQNVVTVKATTPFASEDGGDPGVFTLTRSGGGTQQLMVGYIISGTAIAPFDHTLSNRWVSLDPGVNTLNINVTNKADFNVESSESCTLVVTWVLRMDAGVPTSIPPGSPNKATVIFNDSTTPSGTGLLGQYYDTSSTTYTNSANFDPAQLKVTRVDPTVDFDWLYGTPNGTTKLTNADNYSVVWEGFLSNSTAGSFTFQLDADDKARIILNGNQILENGWDTPATGTFKQSSPVSLSVPANAAARHTVRVEFVETNGNATCRLQWKPPGATAFANIPSTNVFTDNANNFAGWKATFYTNTSFNGPSVGIETNSAITAINNGIWGQGTPAPSIVPDTFSVRWTGQVQPQFSEEYTFVVNADDAVRLRVNGQQLTLLRTDSNVAIDWPTSTTVDRYARITLAAGVRYDIQLDYFENTGTAKCQLSWYSLSQPKQIIPSIRLYPASGPLAPAAFTGNTEVTAQVGGLFTYTLTGNNGASISITDKPVWLNLNGAVLSGRPPSGSAGDYQIVITVTGGSGSGTSVLNLHVADNTGNPIVREYWNGVAGTSVADIPVSAAPTGTANLSSLETPTDFGDNYGSRIRGYLTAPFSGNYYFWIAANNSAELWIANDDEPVNTFKRAWVTGGSTTPRTWNAQASQKSPWMALEQGKKYYFEVLHKAGTGAGDNLAVGWLLPGEAGTVPSEVVPGYALSPYVASTTNASVGTLYFTTLLQQPGSPVANPKGVGKSTLRVFENANPPYAIMTRSYENLTGVITSEHIHADPYLANSAQIVFDIDAPATPGDGLITVSSDPNYQTNSAGDPIAYKWTINAVGTLSRADLLEIIRQGKAYINLHTALNPNGEIRGNYALANGTRTFTAPPAPPAWTDDHTTDAGAVRFLTQATFGPNPAEIAALKAMPSYEAWINDQFTKPSTRQLPEVLAREQYNVFASFDDIVTFDTWWKNAISAPDQLRQRIAFALSEIHVASAAGPLADNSRAISFYYDQFTDNAFGNFRTILQNTTLTPGMGRYLDMLKNDKPDISIGRSPNENYGREIMQLFSVGLYRMWPDGTLMLNSKDSPIDTYSQREIVGISHVFTGWDYGYDGAYRTSLGAATDWTRMMREVPVRHFTGQKRLLNNEVLPGLTNAGGLFLDPYATHTSTQYNDTNYQALPAVELSAVHDQLFNHPNVGPFVCRQLIQRLVTSHPSRDYVYRVVQKFNDNGSGVRGDMQAVIKGILLDYEARSKDMYTTYTNNLGGGLFSTNQARASFGKQREPIMRVAAAARAFRPSSFAGSYDQNGTRTNTITTTTPHRLQAGNSVFLEFTNTTGLATKPAPSTGIYSVASVVDSTHFTINSSGWSSVGTYSQGAASTTVNITLAGNWLPAGGQAYFDFINPTAGTLPTDGVYTAVTSDQFDDGVANRSGTNLTITMPSTGVARSGTVMISRFQSSYSRSTSGGITTVTIDTGELGYGGAGDHHLAPGDQVFLNFVTTRASGIPNPDTVTNDLVYTVASVTDSNTFTIIAANLSNEGSDNGVYVFPLKSQPTVRNGAVAARMGTFNMGVTDTSLGQTPLNSPTVFNFYLPDYKFPGTLSSEGITTPEFQVTSETTVIRQMNYLYSGVFTNGNTNGVSSFSGGSGGGPNALVMDLSPWTGLADNSLGMGAGPAPTEPWTSDANLSTLIDRMNTLLVAGQLSSAGKQFILNFITNRVIASVSVANPTTVTTTGAHGLATGDLITISGVTGGTYKTTTNSSVSTVINTTNTVTVTGATTFTVPVNCQVAPTSVSGATVATVPYSNTAPTATNLRDRIRAVVHLILTSPDFTIQR